MKYHTTVSNIMFAALILFAVVIGTIALGPFEIFGQAGRTVAVHMLERLEGEGKYSLRVESVESSLFSRISVHGLVLADTEGKQMLRANRITIDAPAYRFLTRRLYPKSLPITVDGLDILYDERFAGFLQELAGDDQEGQDPSPGTFRIELSDSRVSYAIDAVMADAENLFGSLLITEGTPTQAQIRIDELSVSHSDLWSARAGGASLGFGPTADGQLGARLDVGKIQFSHRDSLVSLSTDSLALFFFGTSFESMMGLNGSVVGELEDLGLSLLVEDKPVNVTLGNLRAQSSLQGSAVDRAQASLNLLAVDQGPWRFLLPESQLVYDAQGEGTNIEFSSEAMMQVLDNEDMVASVDRPSILLNLNSPIASIRLGTDVATVQDSASLGARLGIRLENFGRMTFDQAHLLAVHNTRESLTSLEASFALQGETDIRFLQSLSAQVFADAQLEADGTFAVARTSIRELTSADIPGSLMLDARYDRDDITIQLSHSEGIQASLEYDRADESARISTRFSEFSPYSMHQVIKSVSPDTADLVVPETSLEGNLNLQLKRDGTTGRATAELGIANLAVEDQRFNIATTVSGRMDETDYVIDLATLTTEGFRLSYSGSIDRIGLIPEGSIDVREVESGEQIVAADFQREATRVYRYAVTSPKTPRSRLDGVISWAQENLLTTDAVLSVPGKRYPVTVSFDIPQGEISLSSDNLGASFDFLSDPGHVTFDLAMSELELPEIDTALFRGIGKVSGTIGSDVSLADGLYIIRGEDISLDGLSWSKGGAWSVGFSFDADQGQLLLNEVTYRDAQGEVTGNLSLANGSLQSILLGSLDRFSLQALFRGSDGSFIGSSFFHDPAEPHIARGSLSIKDFHLGRFGLIDEQGRVDFEFLGETDLKKLAKAHGSLDLGLGADRHLSFGMHLESDSLVIEDARYRTGPVLVGIEEAIADFSGEIKATGNIFMDSPMQWRDASSRISFEARTVFDRADSFFVWLDGLARLADGIPPITVSHRDASLYGMIGWTDGSHEIQVSKDQIRVIPLDGGTLSGLYRFRDGLLAIEAARGFPIPLKVSGHVDRERISLEARDISFDMPLLNSLLLEPIIWFESGTFSGNLMIDGPTDDPDYYGTLTSDSVGLTTFWTVGELFSLKNPVITVSENLATVAATDVSAVHESGRATKGRIRLEASLEQWNVPHYRIDILGLDDPISFWLPMYATNVNVLARVQGSFSIDGTPTEETLYGDITVSDALVNFDVPARPSWMTDKTRTSIDMTLRTGRNVSFIYPNEDSPILRATFDDGQSVGITVQAPSMATSFSGELALRSGEIYYVQKNFYITEGSLRFPPATGDLASDGMPTLSLRARLREFDPDGTRVDIYMVLQDARFDALDPRFESIPLRSTNEILEMLGQNIVSPGTVGESGLQSVVSVASAATDVFSRLGLLQGTALSLGFTNVIRQSLGLDVFTIRSNLLQNILFDAIPGISADTTVSPLARYLDNTTMYIGKYILDDFYLQGMLHFRQTGIGSATSFLANDLQVDTELSLEWANPLATFSLFTQPEELSVFDLFDTMGFSVTKRFEF